MLLAKGRSLHAQNNLNFYLVFVVLLLQLANPNTGGSQAKPVKKVRVGTQAPRTRFPYMCSLRKRGNRGHVCGGTLIRSQWVLTAAHCVDPASKGSAGSSPLVYCGIYKREESNSSKVFAVDRMFPHPQWSNNISLGYDIALIKLDRASDSPIPGLHAQGSLYTTGNSFAALGWGYTSSGSFADSLQIADALPFVPRGICNRETFWADQILESMICAGNGEQDTDEGDSGGPLLQLHLVDGDYTLGKASSDVLVGITSFGEDPAEPFKPGVYTSVSYFRDWIECITEEKVNCSTGNEGTTETVSDAEEASSTSGVTASVVAQASLPAYSLESSSVSFEPAMEPFMEFPEPLAQSSEEDASEFDVSIHPCAEITQDEKFNATIVSRRLDAAVKEDDFEIVAELLCDGLAHNETFYVSRYSVHWTLLHEAASYDAVQSATVLIDAGLNMESSVEPGYRPLHTAARYNSSDVAKLLVVSGADIEARSWLEQRPLHVAAIYNSEQVAKVLIDARADIESRASRRETPLHLAAKENSLAVATLLIDVGAYIDSEDTYDYTPLHYAARYGSLEVAEVLLENGADDDIQNSDGRTPLHYAVMFLRLDIVQLLIENGASRTAKDDDGRTPVDHICRVGICSNEQLAKFQQLFEERDNSSDDNHEVPRGSVDAKETSSRSSVASPVVAQASQSASSVEPSSVSPEASIDLFDDSFEQAIEPSSSTSAESLVEPSLESREPLIQPSEEGTSEFDFVLEPCENNTRDRDFSNTLALKVARRAVKEDDSDTLEHVLCLGLNPETTFVVSQSQSRQTLLHEAAIYDAVESAMVLIDEDVYLDRLSLFNNNSPLHFAALYNSAKVAKLLIDSGANIEVEDKYGSRPLHKAARMNSYEVAKLLIESGADIESRGVRGSTPLHYAAFRDSVAVAQLLIDSGANITSKGVFRNTPLHDAARKGSTEVAEVLVDSGADVDAKSNGGRTPLHWAAGFNRPKAAQFLIKNGASKTAKDDDGSTPFDEICEIASCSDDEVDALQELLRI